MDVKQTSFETLREILAEAGVEATDFDWLKKLTLANTELSRKAILVLRRSLS